MLQEEVVPEVVHLHQVLIGLRVYFLDMGLFLLFVVKSIGEHMVKYFPEFWIVVFPSLQLHKLEVRWLHLLPVVKVELLSFGYSTHLLLHFVAVVDVLQ